MRIILLLIAIIVANSSFAQKNDVFFEQISPESGFAFDAVYTIVEDCNGLVWFGCNNGLYHYNTRKVEKIVLSPENSTHHNSFQINKLYKDDTCRLWACTELGLFTIQRDRNEIRHIQFDEIKQDLHKVSVENILQLNSDTFLLVINKTLYKYSLETEVINEVKNTNYNIKGRISFLGDGKEGQYLLGTIDGQTYVGNKGHVTDYSLLFGDKGSQVRDICIDEDSFLIGFDGTGIVKVDQKGRIIDSFNEENQGRNKLPSNRVRSIIKRPDGEIWVGTYNGILVVSKDSSFIIKKDSRNGLPYNSIYDLYQNINEGIWVGTWAGGLAYYSDYNYRFKHYSSRLQYKSESQSITSAFIEDQNKNIWIGSDDGELMLYDSDKMEISGNINLPDTESLRRIKCMETDDGVNVYISKFNSGLWHYNANTKNLRRVKEDIFDSNILISTITKIENELWIGTREYGLFRYNILNSEVQHFDLVEKFPDAPLANWIWKTVKDSENNLWITTDNGLFKKSYGETRIVNCLKDTSLNDLNSMTVYTILEETAGIFWLGTKGKGLFRYHADSGNVEPFVYNEFISNVDVYGILTDDNQDLWFSTNNGIFQFDRKNNDVKQFSSIHGLSGKQYIPNAAFKSSNGNLFFGATNGFNLITPALIRNNPIPPQVTVTEILINNQTYEDVKGKWSNPYYISGIQELNLKHDKNTLTFGFASNNYIKASGNQFKYRLVNYMNEWTITDHGTNITFTKLPPGKYELEIIGSNNDDLWSSEPINLPIIINPPFWFTWYAYLIYFSVFTVVVLLFLKQIKMRLHLRKEIMAEKFRNEANETLYQEKIKIFTNISHEFRTPLTLIISPINSLLKKHQFEQESSNQLKVIKRNSERLLRLTDGMLDFRLMELGKIKVDIQKANIIAIATNVIDCFEFQIIEKKISFVFTSNFKFFWMKVDSKMIEKIIYKLLANALKFSFEKGRVLLSIEKKKLSSSSYDSCFYTGEPFLGDSLEIRIRDFGVGIRSEMLPTIFERFSKTPDNNESGVGIGLHMCQEYAKLNNGNIMVYSEYGKGSSFILNIPIKDDSRSKSETVVIQPYSYKLDDNEPLSEKMADQSKSEKVILVAENHDDLRIYLKNILSKYYKVLTSKNGIQALETINEVIPDIIITDIIMPGMDGLELTKATKSNPKTSFIPVIILTALSERHYQLKGLSYGADSYLIKPIDESILMAQIQNIIKARESLRKRFDTESGDSLHSKNYSPLSFIELAEKIVLDNLQKSSFNITELATQLSVSHSSLHRKIKMALNQSPTEFIRDIRLKIAVQLMKDIKYNMDEIGTYVGFNSTSYFMRSFKKKYGKTPREYRKGLRISRE